MSNGKVMIIYSIVGLIKKTLYKMSEHFPKSYTLATNCATKTDLKIATGIDNSKLAAKSDLICLKAEVDKVDTDKLKPVPVALCKLNNIVKNEVVKKTSMINDKLVNMIN